ncbi:MAG: indolepyruvate oxidoreductase subunit beta [Ruminococcus sp.]|nr:indolepyruvate oxidoreductase subunit beta [Ruminococcus sp.]
MNIVISGVGGQGTILASKILAEAAKQSGAEFVRTGETIGMSQRGGSVLSFLREGNISSPYIQKGGADLLLSFELCEGARNLPYLKKGGNAVINTAKIKPLSVSLGNAVYDEAAITGYINENSSATFIDAEKIAVSLGNAKCINIVMLGAAFGKGFLNFGKETLIEAIKSTVKPQFTELNINAFEKGIEATEL